MLLALGFYIIVSCLVHRSLQADLIAKCCGKNFEIRQTNLGSLECTEKSNTRFQILTDSYDFLRDNDREGECIDLTKGRYFFNYKMNGSGLVTKSPISAPPFPKCCPLEHVYNKKKRSCQENATATTTKLVKEQFVKIGLPHCQMILDKTFESLEEATALTKGLSPENFCLDNDVAGQFVVRECQKGLYLCEQKRCFKKCCSDGESYVGGGTCRDTYVHGLHLESQWFSSYIDDPQDEYELIYGAGCSRVSLLTSNKIQYRFLKQGEFRYFYNFTNKFEEHHYSNLKSYCLEHATKGNFSGYQLFWCLDQQKLAEKFTSTLWAKILSCVLLLVTIFIYFYLGEVKSTFGKILVNYCLAMIFLLVTLTVTHIVSRSGLECKIRAYFLIFFAMSTFAWVNVMSIDIWCTFGTPKRTIGSDQRKKDLKKFLLYLLYGWGMPLCQTLLILIFDNTKVLPESIQPYVGIFSCFLENRNYARTVWFLIPELIFQIINMVLLVKTIMYCIKVKNEISKMNDSTRNKEDGKFNADMERFGLIVKLAVIMGLIWIFEITTAFFENMKTYSDFTKTLEVILDTVICLQGVFIFLIFICKKKTFNNIKKKLGLGERRTSTSMSVTHTSQANGHYPMNKRQTTLSLGDSKI